jgi:hypothetical protein
MRSPLPTRVASYLLGGFVCLQLVYLPVANIIQRVPRRMPPLPEELITRRDRQGRASDLEVVQTAIDRVGWACDRYGELTAQGQGWSLFAPRFGENGTFLTLQVIADGSATELPSRFEPADVNDYVRFDMTNYRLLYREASYAIVFSTWTPDSFVRHGPEWRQDIRDVVATFRRSLSAYVRWRLREEYGGPQVHEVIVVVRVYPPPKPGEADPRPSPVVLPLAKWSRDRPDELVPFDPVSGTFLAPSS